MFDSGRAASAFGPAVDGPPFVWLGHDLKSPFHVWEHVTGCQGVCLSAAQVLTKPGFNRDFRTRGLSEVLSFKGRVFLDSGGFRFQRTAQDEFDSSDVLELYRSLGPDVAAILDCPMDPTLPDAVNTQRWRQTLRNTRRMLDDGGELNLVPVIHAYDGVSASARHAQLREVFPNPSMLCVGSLVPLLRASYIGKRFSSCNEKGASATIERWAKIAEVITTIRKLEPSRPIHVFGAGSLSTISLLLLLGINSIDSTGWRMKAAFGAIQLPGLGDRFPQPARKSLKTRRGLSSGCLDQLSVCNCPSCGGQSLARRIKCLGGSFHQRAIHNAHVLISEVDILANAMRRGKGAEFVGRRFEATPYYHRVLHESILPQLPRGVDNGSLGGKDHD